MAVGDLSDANSEEWSDSGDDSSSESDSGVEAIATHAHASQPLSSKISANIHSLFYQLFGFLVLRQLAFNVSNAAISALLKFIKYFILLLGRALILIVILSISANELPISREVIVQLLNSNKKIYTEYVVCPSCDSLYQLKDCI